MKALIVEDEIPAQASLKNALGTHCSDVEVIGMLGSVKQTVNYFREHPTGVDVVFLDVELSDGMCFDIFDQIEVPAKVIITTAYDNYAIRAFRINSIDYLLKPIDPDELQQAVSRCRTKTDEHRSIDLESLRAALSGNVREFKRRFIIRLGDRIVIIPAEQVAYFYSEDKSTYLVTHEGRRHILDLSLDAVQEQIDPKRFFRISRSCIVEIDAIDNISKHLNNRLKLTLSPKADFDAFVSRFRIADFMEWIEGK